MQTVVGQTFICVHRSPAVFSDPEVFTPDRWLGEDVNILDASLVAFSKGPRSCIGINLAYCELYVLIAGIFRRFDVTLDAKRYALCRCNVSSMTENYIGQEILLSWSISCRYSRASICAHILDLLWISQRSRNRDSCPVLVYHRNATAMIIR